MTLNSSKDMTKPRLGAVRCRKATDKAPGGGFEIQSTGTESRAVAAEVVARWLKTGDFPDRLIGDDVRDHAFVTDLVFCTVRRRRALEFALSRFVKKNPGNEAMAVLLVGACQLLYMDSVADHAALHETVEAAKTLCRHQAGFVNAVLRNIQRSRDAIHSALTAASIGVRESHPGELVMRWTAVFGEAEAARLCVIDNLPSETVLTVLPFTQPEKAAELVGRIRAAGFEAHRHPVESGAVIVGHGCKVTDLPGFAEGLFTVQDAAPLTALRLLAPQPGETILDACAAPGGKTVQIAAAVGAAGRVFAMDLHDDRLGRLRENVQRAGVGDRVTVLAGDAASPGIAEKIGGGHLDAILADVPCSNTGVLRRRADARWRFNAKRLAAIRETQLKILENLAALRPGRIVYSTCSIEKEEDECLIADFLKAHGDWRLEKSVKLLPDDSPRDGAFAALLVARQSAR